MIFFFFYASSSLILLQIRLIRIIQSLSMDDIPPVNPQSEQQQHRDPVNDIEIQLDPVQDRDDDIIQLSPFAVLPAEILGKVFSFVPLQSRINVASVCKMWNRACVVQSAVCWRGLRLGKNANCFSAHPFFDDNDDILPLSHVEEVQFDPAVPMAMMRRRAKLPLPWLRVVLIHGAKVKRLDLSRMGVSAQKARSFRSLIAEKLLQNVYDHY